MSEKVWFIADTHFSHQALIHNKYRPFKTIEDHDKTIIDNWNSVVSENDTVFCLGDMFFCDKNKSIEIMNRLKGRKILILGNHDTRKISYYYGIGFEEVVTNGEYEGMVLTHKPLGFKLVPRALNKESHTFNVHGHIHKGTHRSDSMDIINLDPEAYYCVSVDQTDFTPVEYCIINMARCEWTDKSSLEEWTEEEE